MDEGIEDFQPTKDILTYIKEGKVVKEINLTPVNEITNRLEQILMKRKNFSDRSHAEYSVEIMKKMKELNKDQLEYLGNAFVGLIIRYADMLQMIYDNPEKECKKIKETKDFLQKARDIIKT